jgi:hypothetical protein
MGIKELGGPEFVCPQTEIGLVHRFRRWTRIFFLVNIFSCFRIAAKSSPQPGAVATIVPVSEERKALCTHLRLG